MQNLCAFFNVGEHNVIKLENADWNDGLDMAGDKGESVAFSFIYAYNLQDIANCLKLIKKSKTISVFKELLLLLDCIPGQKRVNYNKYQNKQQRLEEYFSKIKSISGEIVTLSLDDVINDLEKKSKHMFSWLKRKEWIKPVLVSLL